MMQPSQRHQLQTLDRALLALLNERARLAAELPAGATARAAIEDLLRRHEGPFATEPLRSILALAEEGCRP